MGARRVTRARASGSVRLARFVADPQRSLDRLDRVSRLWPVSACFGAFGYVAVRSAVGGHGSAAAIYAALAAAFVALLLWLLHLDARLTDPPARRPGR